MGNLFGFGAFGAARPSATRAALTPENAPSTPDDWARDCSSPLLRDGTEWRAGWANFLTANLRALVRRSGVPDDNTDDALIARAVRSQRMNYPTAGGTANAISITLNPAPADWASLEGTPLNIKLAATNTGAATLAVTGLSGTRSILRPGGAALIAGDLGAGMVARVMYDGAAFQLAGMTQSQLGSTVGYFTPGTFSWVCPPGVFSVRVQSWGGGGGGGGATALANSVASAGGGGEYREGVFAVTPGVSYNVVVGAGGAAGLAVGPTNGGNGGTSSFGAMISAIGGGGGLSANGALQLTAGAGGSGGAGGSIVRPGLGGGGAYPIGAGSFVLGQGGSSFTGNFTYVVSTGGAAQGPSGIFPGGGASGGALFGNGGVGSGGQVILTF